MVEGIHRVKDKGRIPNKDIHLQGSSNSSNREKTGMITRVREGPSPFEDQMLQFMWDNKRLLHLHEHKLSDLEVFKYGTQIFQKNTSASLKNLETQVG